MNVELQQYEIIDAIVRYIKETRNLDVAMDDEAAEVTFFDGDGECIDEVTASAKLTELPDATPSA